MKDYAPFLRFWQPMSLADKTARFIFLKFAQNLIKCTYTQTI